MKNTKNKLLKNEKIILGKQKSKLPVFYLEINYTNRPL